mmetsp:Transcript_4758/g.8152  ORF Transcript_4758/g.8152 Transcript_4758/m.8152 type:complete len:419 (+) Transcript_4758:97-1353(+)
MADMDSADDVRPRGWAMRKGHRRRLTREDDKESARGRARYSQSVTGGRPWPRFELWSIRKSTNTCCQRTLLTQCSEELWEEDLDWDVLDIMVEDAEWWEGTPSQAPEPSEDSWSWASECSDDEDALNSSKALESTVAKDATRWEQAQALANQVACEYLETAKMQPRSASTKDAQLAKKRSVSKSKVKKASRPRLGLSTAAALPLNCLTGKPQGHLLGEHYKALGFSEHEEKPQKFQKKELPTIADLKSVPKKLRKHVVSASQLLPWRRREGNLERPVHEESEEYRAVTDYFVKTLMLPRGASVKFGGLGRLPKPGYFLSDGNETVMFHGCKSSSNEKAIMRDGFQVSCCRSHGSGFGTWLAYNAVYSNGGYVFQDESGWRHIFVCIASHVHTVLDNDTMRVVGQHCAYPQWLLRYQIC